MSAHDRAPRRGSKHAAVTREPDCDLPSAVARVCRQTDLPGPAPRVADYGARARASVLDDGAAAVPMPARDPAADLRLETGVSGLERRAVRLCGRHRTVRPLPVNPRAVPRLRLRSLDLGDEKYRGAAGGAGREGDRRRDADDERGLVGLSGEEE